MRTAELDILVLPGLGGGSADHWYQRWAAKLKTMQIVEQDNWDNPTKDSWVDALLASVDKAEKPVFLIGHSLGALTIAHAAAELGTRNVKGAFLAATTSLEIGQTQVPAGAGFATIPTAPFPFPAAVLASRTDPYCPFEKAEAMALDWGAMLVDAGDHGHLNDESGHGPWPEGLMVLAKILKQIEP